MAPLTHASLGRSLSRLAIQVTRESNTKAHEGDRYMQKETEQQFQIDILGKARVSPAVGITTLHFDEVIFCEVAKRDNPNVEPHVYIGKVIDHGPHVFVDAHVKAWIYDVNGNFVGCTVRVAAYDPADSRASFSGRVHVTIQGFSAPQDDDEPSGDGQGSGAI